MHVNRIFLPLLFAVSAWSQSDDHQDGRSWSIHFQATSIGQRHGPFDSPYEGKNSLPSQDESRVSLTATLFVSLQVNSHWEFVFNPEVAGGRGFGGVTGIAGFPNGEIPRVASATPTPYIARAYIRYTIPIGTDVEEVENAPNQTAATVPVSRWTSIAGKFAITDFFDNNTYSHDPRTQFMNWSLMYNGAWDYPADTRGYTAGVIEELRRKNWAFRAAVVMEPTTANGGMLDTRIARNRGSAFELERWHNIEGHAGAIRILAFENREDAGAYRAAMHPLTAPDVDATRRSGREKYGLGLNLEQELCRDVGAFGRYGWNDGKTETWAFTEIDRSVSGGITVRGRTWRRPHDSVGTGFALNFLSGDHRSYLAVGGLGFIIGDGRLNYGPERVSELYYAFHVNGHWTVTGDFQKIKNPAYNQDRGPVSVASIRLHWEL